MPASPPAALQVGFGTPFAEQIAFLRAKLDLPTQRWDDIARAAHDRAFIAAGAAKADLLADLHAAVIQSAQGGSLGRFRKEFAAIVARHGWTGWTGEGSREGVAWRTRVIHQTNLATSHAAGRWAQLTDPDTLAGLPYWQYVHSDSVLHPRPQHQAWNGLTLRHDHPFWRTHFPPNGWGCRCTVYSVRRPRSSDATEPPPGWDQADARTGAPLGIDKGFDYAPGASAKRPLQELVDEKLIKLEAPIGAAMWQALKPALAMERQAQWWETLDTWLADSYARKRTAVVGSIEPSTLERLSAMGQQIPDSAEVAVTDTLIRGPKQKRHEAAQNALTVEEWRALPALIERPAGIYLDTRSGHLMFVGAGDGPAKIALEFTAGPKGAMNLIVSAFRVSSRDVVGSVKGGLWRVVQED